MPIVRYFVFVGGILLTLILAAERYLPEPELRATTADPDKTTIRIKSARSLPEKIVFDTRPRADLPQVARAEPASEASPWPVHEAMAAMAAALPPQTKQEPAVRSSSQSRPHEKRTAKQWRRTSGPRLALDRHGPFFGDW